MTLPYSQTVTTLKRVTVAEPTSPTFIPTSPVGLNDGTTTYRTVNISGAQLQPVGINDGATTYRTVNIAGGQLQPVQYINSSMDGAMMYGGTRYLVPVQQRQESVMLVSQAPRIAYVQNVQPMTIETDVYRQESINGQSSSISSPVKSPEPLESETTETSSIHEEYVDRNVKNIHINTEVVEVDQVEKMDNRFFGELLAEVYRKNIDIHTCISDHVSKIRGRKHLLDTTIDYKVEKEEIEALIPKGASELTKQQIRYLLQTRLTADKAMRLLLTTFSSLREELVHLQDDLRRLESEKEELERDLSFKADQAAQYDRLLETVREHNRQLQMAVKESNIAQRALESQVMDFQTKDPSKDFQIRELESNRRALEQENEILRKKLAGQGSSASLEVKTQELSRHYEQMLKDLREEKERELKNMRSQMVKIQTERTITQTTDTSGLEMRIKELISKLELRESTIKQQEEEIRRLKMQKSDSSSHSSNSTSQTIVTKRYQTQYPILGLLNDDYKYTAPIKEDRTIVFQTTGESIKRY